MFLRSGEVLGNGARQTIAARRFTARFGRLIRDVHDGRQAHDSTTKHGASEIVRVFECRQCNAECSGSVPAASVCAGARHPLLHNFMTQRRRRRWLARGLLSAVCCRWPAAWLGCSHCLVPRQEFPFDQGPPGLSSRSPTSFLPRPSPNVNTRTHQGRNHPVRAPVRLPTATAVSSPARRLCPRSASPSARDRQAMS